MSRLQNDLKLGLKVVLFPKEPDPATYVSQIYMSSRNC